jgi:ATP-binding cassette, subfamily F, member 3
MQTMSVLRLQNVSVRFGEKWVLREVFFKLAKGERVGLIGQNGTGKTTLIRLALTRAGLSTYMRAGEELTPVEGTVEITPNLNIGYFSQFSMLDSDLSVVQILEEVLAEPRQIEAELEQIAQENNPSDALLNHQSDLFERMELIDGWNWRVHIETALGRLGFSEENRHRPIGTLSGGWRNRAALAQIILQSPDVLLLDEPTNYLDVEGVTWLEEWLHGFTGAVLLVSHDREFLDKVVTRLVEIENYHLSEYIGNYSDYVREKPFRLKTSKTQFLHEEELLILEAEGMDARKEQRALQKNPSDSLRRKIADVKKRTEPRPSQMIITDIYQGLPARNNLLRVENVGKSYGTQPLFSDISLEVHAGERLAIVGKNGSGKTTFLKLLTGEETPDSGKVIWEGGVRPSYFNQILENLDPKDTLTHAVNIFGMAYHAPKKQVNRFLEMLRFSEMDLGQRLGTLSGGQKARVALAQCLLSGSPVIILDEPTNHLDVPSIQVMEQALLHFPGAVIVVSHDRFFIDKIATHRLVF